MRLLPLLAFLFAATAINAQLSIDTTISAETLVDKILVGNGIRVGNIKFNTDKRAIGYFKCPENKVGIKSGLVLTTGLATNATGPNTQPGMTGQVSVYSKKWRGDKDLNRLAKGLKTYDVSIIEFDFIPTNNKVTFEYSFGSEEYKEYVGSQFNDVFGFFISGPGIKKKNVALLPNKKFVAINNINHKVNKQLFVDNDPFINNKQFKNISYVPKLSFWQKLGTLFSRKSKQGNSVLFYTNAIKNALLDQTVFKTFQYDGLTKKLKVQFYATPYQKYHIKIAIGDVGDNAFDSGVFIEEHSFVSVKDTTQPKFTDYADRSSTISYDSIFKGLNPNKPLVTEDTENYETFEKTIVYFGSDSYELPDSCKSKLRDLAALMQKHPTFSLTLTGFADNTGNEKKNQVLSEKRATAITYYLTELGVDRNNLEYIGKSSEDPVGDNTTNEGRALNRRVEIDLSDE